ncbi:hypothetical protein [Streptomyces rishiriensis]|uniref:hypothetical protein n=1 Tax=Streptomyces rishiriensis TaxID=68264 RepID=UPI000D59B08D|nr:hypothetical protein [Streptomyces rishiriensis]
MICIVTAGHLRRMSEAAARARARAREVQGLADAAWARHVREVWELTARAESEKTDAAILREDCFRLRDALTAMETALGERAERIRVLGEELEAARLAGRSLVLLLHWGEPHSIHSSHEDAYAYAATKGVPVHAWKAGDERPASQVLWRLLTFTRDEAVKGFRDASMPSPEGWEGAA